MLPVLREDLALYPGPTLADGQPSWTLQDPARNLFFRLDWSTFEILSRWSLGDPDDIAASIACATSLKMDHEDVLAVAQFLIHHQLVHPAGDDSAAIFATRLRHMRGSWLQRLLHHYLFFRIPLIHPDRWLTRWVARVAVFYQPLFWRLTVLALVVGLVQIYRDWDRFAATMVDTLTLNGLMGYACALAVVKVAHELGHAWTAKRYGCRVPVMGVAFLVLWPVAYTDTNEVWKLSDRWQRLTVSGAGVIAELILASWSALAWALLPDGVLKSVAFMLTTTSLVATLVVNANPFMRFDGYFLLCDWLDSPNLHERAFALARWRLREYLFDLGEQPPEFMPVRRRWWLILFAYATWIYRLMLFVGIAVLVYSFFIKAVGILLFVVEVVWFIVRPVMHELRQWQARWPVLVTRLRARRTGLGLLLLGALLLWPLPGHVSASAWLRPVNHWPVHAPDHAQLVDIVAVEGASVTQGQRLLQLHNPELDMKHRSVMARINRLQWLVSSADFTTEQRLRKRVLHEELAAAEAERVAIHQEQERYGVVAPFAGLLRDISPDLRPNVWVGKNERLAVLIGEGGWHAETYLDEEAVARVMAGNQARFYPDGMAERSITMTVRSVDPDATRVLPHGILASQYGGSVITRERNGQLIPDRSVYRVTLELDSIPGVLAGHSWRGRVVIEAAWEAPGLSFLRAAMALIWREAGL
ncbi:MAG: site-2 protease family protein [Magnetococcales bacterium]|nr:site-2 protease family protein [Magnetococcales bacterium]